MRASRARQRHSSIPVFASSPASSRDYRPGRNRFNGIVLQEYSVAERKLIGERKNIFAGTAIGFTEGSHIYKRDGWYYVVEANKDDIFAQPAARQERQP